MLESMLASFSEELIKIAADSVARKADVFLKADQKNWDGFEKNLKSVKFQRAVLRHPAADEKMKRYVEEYGEHLRSRDVITAVPSSRLPKKDYTVKRLDDGRLSCGCPDWQYRKSHQGGDCKHVRSFKASGLAKGLKKVANASMVLRGVKLMGDVNQMRELRAHGDIAEENFRRLRQGRKDFLHPVRDRFAMRGMKG